MASLRGLHLNRARGLVRHPATSHAFHRGRALPDLPRLDHTRPRGRTRLPAEGGTVTLRPCLDCGTPTAGSRCPTCQPARQRTIGSAHQRGYDSTWRRLSQRARRLQPWCSACGAVENLTTDHLPSAWQRRAEGKTIRLADVAVVCGPCNTRRGSSRPGTDRAQGHAGRGSARQAETEGEAKNRLHTDDRSRVAL